MASPQGLKEGPGQPSGVNNSFLQFRQLYFILKQVLCQAKFLIHEVAIEIYESRINLRTPSRNTLTQKTKVRPIDPTS
jgi:hypothetical protein